MMRFLLGSLTFLLLASIELGFVYGLPFPLDRTPLILIVSVFTFQSLDVRQGIWWVAAYGLVLDLLHVSFVPWEFVSYALASTVLVLTARHLFSNRSFWGILGTFTLSLLALTLTEILFAVTEVLFNDYALSLREILLIRAWSWALGTVVLLFLFPLHEFFTRIRLKLVGS